VYYDIVSDVNDSIDDISIDGNVNIWLVNSIVKYSIVTCYNIVINNNVSVNIVIVIDNVNVLRMCSYVDKYSNKLFVYHVLIIIHIIISIIINIVMYILFIFFLMLYLVIII